MFHGDFGPLWEAHSFSADDRRYDAEVNDPRALGAMLLGFRRSGYAFDLGRVTAPALDYVGGDNEPDSEKRTAEALGVELQVLPGLDHLQAFSRVDLVMPLVLGFLGPLGL